MTVVFSEPLHHVCLMNGLKMTYGRMPFLNKRVLQVRDKVVTTDNVVPPPPMMSNPNRRTGAGATRNIVGGSYWKDRLYVEYREDLCRCKDITVFVNNLIKDYLHFRHPFMKTVTEGNEVLEADSRYKIAVIYA